jgi:hypothetical protein
LGVLTWARASALAWLLFAIVLVLTIFLFKSAGSWVYGPGRPMTAIARRSRDRCRSIAPRHAALGGGIG